MSHFPKPNQSPDSSIPTCPSGTQALLVIDKTEQFCRPEPFSNNQNTNTPLESYSFPMSRQCPAPSYGSSPGQSNAQVHEQGEHKGSDANYPKEQIEDEWSSTPENFPNCPPGLEYLALDSKLFVKQKLELLNEAYWFQTINKFIIKNDFGEEIYWAVEESNIWTRFFCGRLRPFEVSIMDYYQKEIIHLNRRFNCSFCCFPCCLQKMEVYSPPGNLIGTIEQNWSLFFPQFIVKDASENTVLIIKGPFYLTTQCGQAEFSILSKDGKSIVGKICKPWDRLGRGILINEEYFGISFPMCLDVRMKAVMIGAGILIDTMFFEKNY